MPPLKITELELHVQKVDNQFLAYLNGVLVYEKMTEGNPDLDDRRNLVPQLRTGINTLVLIGINWGWQANYKGSITVNGDKREFNYDVSSSPPGKVWDQTMEIPN